MPPIRSVCVFCASSLPRDPRLEAEAARLGAALAIAGLGLVYGGGAVGLMGTLARAAVAGGARVTGVMPRFLLKWEIGHAEGAMLELVDTMHARKARMSELSDAFIVLPGGIGTLEEMVEILTWRQLRLHDRPVVLVDTAGFWQPFLALLDHLVAQGFLAPAFRAGIEVAGDAQTAVDRLTGRTAPPNTAPSGI